MPEGLSHSDRWGGLIFLGRFLKLFATAGYNQRAWASVRPSSCGQGYRRRLTWVPSFAVTRDHSRE